ncbi:MAG: type II toxin-antitoxin system prevent-host-death family antitoxin [bacterium]|nr:type II toxin-antitoxin system prevent-host-death family antitoxin [bacterium]
MKKVGIAELKARLSEYVRDVRRGHGLVVMDRRSPVARLEPYEPAGGSWGVRRPLRRWPSLQEVPLPAPLRLQIDVVELLLEDRRGDR